MKKHQDTAILLLRIALATGFLSAVSSRLGLWGEHSSGWENFVTYTGKVNAFVPQKSIPIIAILSTILETIFAILLLIGYKIRLVAAGAAILTFLFSLAMTYSFGIKEPLDYSVFTFTAAAYLLSTMPQYRWSIDQKLFK